MNTKNIRVLVDMMEKSSLTAMEIEEENVRVRLERMPGCSGAMPLTAPAPQVQVQVDQAQSAPQAAVPVEKEENLAEVKAPMVGVYYASSSPEAEPYVMVGSRVKKGDILCIIEAMKLMNEIIAEQEGEVAEICVQNGQIVEFGQPLFRLKP